MPARARRACVAISKHDRSMVWHKRGGMGCGSAERPGGGHIRPDIDVAAHLAGLLCDF